MFVKRLLMTKPIGVVLNTRQRFVVTPVSTRLMKILCVKHLTATNQTIQNGKYIMSPSEAKRWDEIV